MTILSKYLPAAIIGLALLLLGCKGTKPAEGTGTAQPAASAASPATPPSTDSDEDKAILAVSKAIRKNKLTGLADECLSYQFDSEKETYVVDVRENHSRSSCGGDLNTAPRLFTVRVAKADGAMTTDQGSISGEFHAIPR